MFWRSELFADIRVTVLTIALSVLVVGWISYELNMRFKMALAHAHFAEAVARAHEHIEATRTGEGRRHFTADGVPTLGGLPQSTGEWIAYYHNFMRSAPGGGPAFVVNAEGNPATGAIGVSATNYGTEVHLTRPAYRGLKAHRVVVRATVPTDLAAVDEDAYQARP